LCAGWGRHDREGFFFREGFSSNKRKILRDHAWRPEGRATFQAKRAGVEAKCSGTYGARNERHKFNCIARYACFVFMECEISRIAAGRRRTVQPGYSAQTGVGGPDAP
jgi:hypothetical protein